MFNLRYHIASLVAVFLALAVGLLLGGVVVERGTLDRQRDSIVKSLQEDFARLSAENDQLRGSVDRQRRFGEQLAPAMLAGRLAGRVVVVLEDPSNREITREVAEAVELAGGETRVVRLNTEGFGIQDRRYASLLSEVPKGDAQARADDLARILADEWSSAGDRPVTAKLRDAGAFGGDELPESPLGALVVAASWQDGEEAAHADPVAVGLASELDAAGVPVAVAEVSSSDTGCIRAASAKGLSAVDHADTPEGALSLVWLLSGRAEGHYGTRQGADGAFPDVDAP